MQPLSILNKINSSQAGVLNAAPLRAKYISVHRTMYDRMETRARKNECKRTVGHQYHSAESKINQAGAQTGKWG